MKLLVKMDNPSVYNRVKKQAMSSHLDSVLGDTYIDPNRRERSRRMGHIRIESTIKAEINVARQTFKKICALAVHEIFYKNCISESHYQRLTAGLYLSCGANKTFHYVYGTLYSTGEIYYYSEFPSFLTKEMYPTFVASLRGFSIPNKTLSPNLASYKIWAESSPIPASAIEALIRSDIKPLEKFSNDSCVKTCKAIGQTLNEHHEFELSRVLKVLDLKIDSIASKSKDVDHMMQKWIEDPKKLQGHMHHGKKEQEKPGPSVKPNRKFKPSAPDVTSIKW